MIWVGTSIPGRFPEDTFEDKIEIPPGSLTVRPLKIYHPKRKGLSSFPIIFQGRAVKLREGRFFVLIFFEWLQQDRCSKCR